MTTETATQNERQCNEMKTGTVKSSSSCYFRSFYIHSMLLCLFLSKALHGCVLRPVFLACFAFVGASQDSVELHPEQRASFSACAPVPLSIVGGLGVVPLSPHLTFNFHVPLFTTAVITILEERRGAGGGRMEGHCNTLIKVAEIWGSSDFGSSAAVCLP